MTDEELDSLYRANFTHSHAAALRGVFDAGKHVGSQKRHIPPPPPSSPVPPVLAPAPTGATTPKV